MKMLSNNTTRREALKRLAAVGALAFLPSAVVWGLPPKQATHFVGLGGAGFQLLQYFNERNADCRFTFADTTAPERIPEYMDFIRVNLSTALPEAMKTHFRNNDRYVLMAGLGGETGTLLIEHLSFWLHHSQKEFITICNLPFTFQGRIIRERAMQAKTRLSALPGFHCFDLDEIGQPNGHLLMGEVFEKADEEFYSVFKNCQV